MSCRPAPDWQTGQIAGNVVNDQYRGERLNAAHVSLPLSLGMKDVGEHRPDRARTILIVEDDANLRRRFRTALHVLKLQVLEAADGLTAFRILETEPPPALVILDLGLPVIS